jgi:hypothetical protein
VADRLTAIEIVRRSSEPWPFRIVEVIQQTNEILRDMPFTQANDGTTHKIVRRSGLQVAATRDYYQGTKAVATQTSTVEEHTGMYQALSEVDADLALHSGDADAVQRTEAVGIINGMGIQQAENFIYGKRTANAKNGVDGFATRLAKIDGKFVIDMGGTGTDLTSVYLVALGDTYLHGIYPRGIGTAGVSVERRGKQDKDDGNGGTYQVLRTYFKLQWGIALENPRSIIRLANIAPDHDPEDLVDVILSKGRRLAQGAPTYAIYGNYTALDIIDKAAYKKPNVVFTATDPWGRPITMLRNFRVRTVEAISDTEEHVA